MKRLSALFSLAVFGLLAYTAPATAVGPGSVSGTVTAPFGVEEVEVCVVESKPSETCTYPRPDGTYTLIEVEAGRQRIEFLPSYRSGLLPQYYNHKATLAEAAVIEIPNEPTKKPIEHIDAALVLGGSIEGIVTAEEGGAALAGVKACALNAGAVAGCDETDASGQYSIHALAGGTYKVGFYPAGLSAAYAPQFYAGKVSLGEATLVSVVAGATHVGVGAQLAIGGRIEGTVSSATGGSQLPGISVCLFAAAATKATRCASTDGAGSYTFAGLPSGSYRVGFSLEFDELADGTEMPEDGSYRTQYYSGASTLAEASALSLLAPAGLIGIDAHLLPSHESVAPRPPPALPAPLLAAPAIPDAPPATARKCKRGYRKRVVKGKTRCVQVRAHKKRHKKRGRY
jgi:Carboxypeptidase regulatory-like domain